MRKALVVGINDYPSYPLNGCVNDAAAFANTIERNGDGSPNFSVRLETNIGTKAALKKMFIELFEGDNDISLLYFSGHGYFNDFGGYVVTPDAQDYNEGVLWMIFLSWRIIQIRKSGSLFWIVAILVQWALPLQPEVSRQISQRV